MIYWFFWWIALSTFRTASSWPWLFERWISHPWLACSTRAVVNTTRRQSTCESKALISQLLIKLINYSCSPYPTRASYSGQADGFRNPMKNELKTTAGLEIISNMDANFLNLHIDKARKTHDDKQLYLITLFTKQTLNLNCLLLTLKCNCSLFKFKFSLNNGHLIFWFAFNLAVHFWLKMTLTLEIPSSMAY